MFYGLFSALVGKQEAQPLVGIDIGTSSIKVMELETNEGQALKLKSVGHAVCPANAVNNNQVVKPEQVGTQIRSILESNDIKATRAIIALPGPCIFTKKISIAASTLKDLHNNIMFEAANYIPHKIEAVHLDYQVLANNGRSMDVLLVAVKHEIVQGYLDALDHAGLEPTIVDIDHFALENMFELNYPEEKGKTVALLNIGSRFSGLNILQDGQSLFTGDVSVGGKLYSDALVDQLKLDVATADQVKLGNLPEGCDAAAVQGIFAATNEHVAAELQRQLGFLWNAAATDRSIEEVYLCGGSAQIPGLLEKLSEKVGLNCKLVDTLRHVEFGESFDRDYLNEIAPAMGVSVGLALRRLGDKQHALT